jgi:hypothetical protein
LAIVGVSESLVLTAEWVDSDLLAHLEELVSEYGVRTYLLLVLHSEILEM